MVHCKYLTYHQRLRWVGLGPSWADVILVESGRLFVLKETAVVRLLRWGSLATLSRLEPQPKASRAFETKELGIRLKNREKKRVPRVYKMSKKEDWWEWDSTITVVSGSRTRVLWVTLTPTRLPTTVAAQPKRSALTTCSTLVLNRNEVEGVTNSAISP